MTLRGSVPEFPLDAVLRFLSQAGKTGTLVLTGERSAGTVGLDAGRVVDAASGEDGGDAALGALFAVPAADFEFRPGELPAAASLSGELEDVLARAREERERLVAIREVVPSDALLFRLSDRAAARTHIELTSDQWRTLLAVNGERDVAAIAEALQVKRRVALGLLAELVRAGAVDAAEPPSSLLPPLATPVVPPISVPDAPPVPAVESWSMPAADAWQAPTAPAAPEPESWPTPEPVIDAWSAPAPAPESWVSPAPEPPAEAWSAPPSDAGGDARLAALADLFPPAPPAESWEAPAPAASPPAESWDAPVPGVPPAMPLPATPAPVVASAPAIEAAPAVAGAPVAEPAKRKGGFLGLGARKAAVVPAPAVPTTIAATTRAGKLAAFSNALIVEYNSGRYGKGRIAGKIGDLLLRVDEQAEPVDRPLPLEGDALSVSALDAGALPEAQAAPYLAFLIAQIHADAERAFGKDKAKQGYREARKQALGSDPILRAADLAGLLPKL